MRIPEMMVKIFTNEMIPTTRTRTPAPIKSEAARCGIFGAYPVARTAIIHARIPVRNNRMKSTIPKPYRL
jgi:hypothetical protein